MAKNKVVEVKIDKEAGAEQLPVMTREKFQGVIARYKAQNPKKYALKEKELLQKLAKLPSDGTSVAAPAPVDAPAPAAPVEATAPVAPAVFENTAGVSVPVALTAPAASAEVKAPKVAKATKAPKK